MMTEVPSPSNRFKSVSKKLTDYICELLELENVYDKVTTSMIYLYVSNIDNLKLIEKFISKSSKFWEQIRNKESLFFEENSGSIFGHFSQENVNKFKDLFTNNKNITEDDMNIIWKYCQTLVKISINHIHEERFPITENGKRSYKKPEYFQEIEISNEAEKWKELGLRELKWEQ